MEPEKSQEMTKKNVNIVKKSPKIKKNRRLEKKNLCG